MFDLHDFTDTSKMLKQDFGSIFWQDIEEIYQIVALFHGFIGNHVIKFFKISVQSVSKIMKIEHSALDGGSGQGQKSSFFMVQAHHPFVLTKGRVLVPEKRGHASGLYYRFPVYCF